MPLALYLATFWLAFWRRPVISERRYRSIFSFFLPLLVAVMAARATQPIAALMGIHLATFFAAAGLFHGQLERSRPSASHLTEFYFWIAVGGACGGVFNTLIAPVIFTGVLEYPLVLILAGLLMDPTDRLLTHKPNLADLLWPMALAGMIGAGVWMFGRYEDGVAQPAKFFLLFGLPAIVCFMFSNRAIRFALGVAFVLSASALIEGGSGRLYAGRGFFGVHRVAMDTSGKFRELYHGSTLHGVQGVDDSVCTPLTYYYPEGPLGQLMSDLQIGASHTVGVVGLGAGSVACYMSPGQKVDFFEIDPIVEHIAKEPKYFSFLSQGKGETRVILGDARLTLGDQPPDSYDLLILDAYSSDSVPVHLLTREALALYLSKLKPGGVLAFHISQRHIDLGPVLKALAKDASLVLREQEHEPSPNAAAARATSSRWIALARDEASLKEIARTPRWSNESRIDEIAEPWTDDYSSVVNLIKW
ncbi:MAG: fused MFS/spermidine synthase [Bdellovibrionia bacterium]